MNTPLQQAAQAMIDRWDSTSWKDTPHTAHYIAELRKELDAELAQSVEPAAWMTQEGESPVPLYLHPPQQAKQVPMTEKQIDKIHADTARLAQIRTTFFIAFARAIEAHHGITQGEKP